MPKLRFLKFYCLNVRFLFRFLGHSIAKQRSFMCVLSEKVMNNQISYFSKSFLTLHTINRGKKTKKRKQEFKKYNYDCTYLHARDFDRWLV